MTFSCLKKKDLKVWSCSWTPFKQDLPNFARYITLLGPYIVMVGLMMLTLFQGHRCVRNINCRLPGLDSCPLWLNCMVATWMFFFLNARHNLCDSDVYLWEIRNFFRCWSIVCTCQKEYWNLLGHHECDKCQTLHSGTTHCALPVHTTFSDLDQISWSPQCWTVLYENFVFLSCYVETF